MEPNTVALTVPVRARRANLERMDPKELIIKVETLQNILISKATGGGASDLDYKAIREELLAEEAMKPLIPSFVQSCRDLGQFWAYVKKFSTYAERRTFIWDRFKSLLDRLETGSISPVDAAVSGAFERWDAEYVREVWQRVLDRREQDPEGAITSARTLLETLFKHILDDSGIPYTDDFDLPKLYRLTAEQLNLAPSQYTEKVFKQILGGCQAVVEGLGALRNKLGDAHGKGKQTVRPAPRHAELAVNLSGAVAVFVLRTWEQRKAEKT